MTPGTGSAGFEGPASVLDAQVEAMMQRVTQDRDRRCAQLRAAVSSQAQGILWAARKEARAAVSAAVARERKEGEQALRQARASALLDRRQRDQERILKLLQNMWTAVTSTLELRWADPVRRKAWTQAAVRQGQALLSARAWCIEHGPGWPQDEGAELVARISRPGRGAVHDIELRCDDGIRAGLRIRIDGACLDATIAGLLASRAQIESEFLAQYLALSAAPARPEDKPV